MAQWVMCLGYTHAKLTLISRPCVDMVAYSCNSNPRKTEAGGPLGLTGWSA